jgi:hypothetical protein
MSSHYQRKTYFVTTFQPTLQRAECALGPARASPSAHGALAVGGGWRAAGGTQPGRRTWPHSERPAKSGLSHAYGHERGVEHPLQVVLPAADMRQHGAALQRAEQLLVLHGTEKPGALGQLGSEDRNIKRGKIRYQTG